MDNGQLTIEEIKKRTKSAFIGLTARSILLRLIRAVTSYLIIPRLLPVETNGIFNIATAIITFFAYFSDVGLAASLIQKKEEVTKDDIKTSFTIQQLIVGSLSLIIILAAPIFGQIYHFGDDGVWLIRILGISFFLTSLKSLPSVLIERELNFTPLIKVEVLETIVSSGLLTVLAFMGFGVWSFSIATFCSALIGLAAIYILAPVKLSLGINKVAAIKLLSFGIPFQINNLLALLKDRLVPLVVAGIVGPQGIGYVTWAQGMAYAPLEIMSAMNRITFPAFSRLQHDQKTLIKAIEKSLFVTTLMVYPVLFGLVAILPFLVQYVVFIKWQPAIPSFYLFAFSAFWAVISTTFTNTLNAIGQVKTTLKLMVLWTALTWVLTPALVLSLGFIGVAVASFIISFTSVLTIILVKRILDVKIVDALLLPVLASGVMAIAVHYFASYFVKDWLTTMLAIIFGGIIYMALILIFGKGRILADLRQIHV
ncbi:MAG: oligosaccharide flippase family protein [Candidatus Daviesbacteria bacterium]|nr:oligosaccharide flippase family protein [Candidatus Daviesbacteria bacterium]